MSAQNFIDYRFLIAWIWYHSSLFLTYLSYLCFCILLNMVHTLVACWITPPIQF